MVGFMGQAKSRAGVHRKDIENDESTQQERDNHQGEQTCRKSTRIVPARQHTGIIAQFGISGDGFGRTVTCSVQGTTRWPIAERC